MNIENQVVLVTGANRGLGRALVLSSLGAGAARVYAGARDTQALAALARETQGRVVPLTIDITSASSLEAAALSAPDVSVLINNAGVLASFNYLTSGREEIARDFATNYYGTLDATKAFLPALKAAAGRGAAALVNVLSVVSISSMSALGGYSASKAAAYSLTQALRVDFGKLGIAVHGVLAGAIDTDMVRGMEMAKTSPDEVARAIIAGVQQGEEDILPDPMSRALFETFRKDPKALERQLAAMSG